MSYKSLFRVYALNAIEATDGRHGWEARGARDASDDGVAKWPILICVLGSFRLLKAGLPVPHHGAKIEGLLANLAFQPDYCLPRDTLLHTLWPGFDDTLACQSLSNIVHNLKTQLSDVIGGKAPILHAEGAYRLNVEAGVGVDLGCFEMFVHEGDQEYVAGSLASAADYYGRAANLYRGEPCLPDMLHPHTVANSQLAIRREQINGRYLTLLARLAECQYAESDYDACLETSFRLLNSEPCREDAHRIIMRCYLRQDQRAQALRQYQLCKQILQFDLGMEPEPSTTALFHQIKLNPESV